MAHGLFPHRENPDGTYDSICPHCFQTVANAESEVALTPAEEEHLCFMLRPFPPLPEPYTKPAPRKQSA
jgi:hypothetical protein